MNVKTKKLGNGISNVIINDPKTYNSLSFKTLRDLLNTFTSLLGCSYMWTLVSWAAALLQVHVGVRGKEHGLDYDLECPLLILKWSCQE